MATIRVAGIADDSIVDGDGMRYTIFCQGCPRRCPGCQNPETQPLDGGTLMETSALLAAIKSNPLLTGVTFSGGEPFLQAAPLAALAGAVHALGKDVWSYTGYTLEELESLGEHRSDIRALLDSIDILVDGEYREAERDLTLHFRGSRNQRIIDMAATRREKRPVLLYEDD